MLRGMKFLSYPRSGSLQGETFSHNRYGQYTRSRSIPVNPGTTFQGTVRSRLATNAEAWRALTALQREGWESLGAMMERTDPLGQAYTLNGFGAFCSVNNNLAAAGESLLSDAPAMSTPSGLLTATISLTAATFSIAYTATPLAASTRLFVYSSPQCSAGRAYAGDLRLVFVSAAAAASPANVFSAYQARFGTPVVGNRIFLALHEHKGGFRSGPLLTSAVVSA